MFYVTITLALALACTAGVQFFYLMFLESANRKHQRRISELEKQNAELLYQLRNTEELLEQQLKQNEESWPEIIEDDAVR